MSAAAVSGPKPNMITRMANATSRTDSRHFRPCRSACVHESGIGMLVLGQGVASWGYRVSDD